MQKWKQKNKTKVLDTDLYPEGVFVLLLVPGFTEYIRQQTSERMDVKALHHLTVIYVHITERTARYGSVHKLGATV